MKKINFGIIGCGAVAALHIKAIKASDVGILKGVADKSLDNAKKFAEANEVFAYDSVEAMLADPEIDAVCVCVPSGFHANVAIDAMKAGKHALIEKPLAVTVEDCDRVIQTAKETQMCAGVISQHRLDAGTMELKELVQGGKLGKIISVDLVMKYFRSQEYYDSAGWRGTWKLDGGSLMNQGIHGVDTMLYVLGSEVKNVYGYARTLNHDMEAEDTATATFELENGALGTILSTTSIYQGYPRQLTISGTKGTIVLENGDIKSYDLEDKEYKPREINDKKENMGFNSPMAIGCEGHTMHINDFVGAINEGRDPLIPLSEGRKTVQLINAIYESSKLGKEIKL